jgi:hypothetical protein
MCSRDSRFSTSITAVRATPPAFFDAQGWDDKHALEYVEQYLTDLQSVVDEAEAQF